MFDKMVEKIDDICSDHPSAGIHIYGDFNNIHHKEWLFHSIIEESRYYYVFFIGSDLTQIFDKSNRVPETTEHHANLQDLFLTCCPE